MTTSPDTTATTPDQQVPAGSTAAGPDTDPTASVPAPVIPTGPRIDHRPRWRRMAEPLAVLGVAAGATAYLYAVDPNEPGHYPLCPTKAFAGIDCPGCGSLRSIHALAHGDVGRAVDHNLLLVAVTPFLVLMWVLWVRRAWTGVSPEVSRRAARWRQVATIAFLVLTLGFWVARLFVPYLASEAG